MVFPLQEWASVTELFGIRVYTWGLFCACGAALCLLLFAFLRRGRKKDGITPLCAFLMIVCGMILSRVLYALDGKMREMASFKAFFMITAGGWSMFGALGGAALGCLLCARIRKFSCRECGLMYDDAVPAMFLFIAAERLGEKFIGEFGISRALRDESVFWQALITGGEYNSYLSTFYFEAACALVLLVICLIDRKRIQAAGDTALLGMMLFGASQVLFESLRFDQHMRISFVGFQQLFAAGCMGAAVLVFALRVLHDRGIGKQKRLAAAAIISIPVVIAALVGLEFMIDRSDISLWLLYAGYIILLCIPCTMGIRLRSIAERGNSGNGKA